MGARQALGCTGPDEQSMGGRHVTRRGQAGRQTGVLGKQRDRGRHSACGVATSAAQGEMTMPHDWCMCVSVVTETGKGDEEARGMTRARLKTTGRPRHAAEGQASARSAVRVYTHIYGWDTTISMLPWPSVASRRGECCRSEAVAQPPPKPAGRMRPKDLKNGGRECPS